MYGCRVVSVTRLGQARPLPVAVPKALFDTSLFQKKLDKYKNVLIAVGDIRFLFGDQLEHFVDWRFCKRDFCFGPCRCAWSVLFYCTFNSPLN